MYDTVEEGLDALDQFIDKISNQDLDESSDKGNNLIAMIISP